MIIDRRNCKGISVADPGGVQGVRTPPPFGPRCRLFNIGPKVGPPLGPPPPFFACRPKMDPPFKNPGSAPEFGRGLRFIDVGGGRHKTKPLIIFQFLCRLRLD